MNSIEKVKNIIAGEQSRREEFYEGAKYALKLLEAGQTAEKEIQQTAAETPKPTIYDRIRNMSVEEMARMLSETTVTLSIKICGEYVIRTAFEIETLLKREAEENHE